MKTLLLLATAIGATALVVPRAQAGISFGISIGPDFPCPPPVRVVAPPVRIVAPPVYAPPVYVAPRPIYPPVVVAPAPVFYAPPPVVYYGYPGPGWKHQHRHYGHYYYRH